MATTNPQIKKLNRGYAVMAVVGLLFIALFGRSVDLFKSASDSQKKAADTYIISEKVIKSVLDTSYGAGGYTNTKQPEFLVIYQQSKTSFDSNIKEALELSTKGSSEYKSFTEIKTQYGKYYQLTQKAISQPEMNLQPADKIFKSLERKRILDDIRNEITSIQSSESTQLSTVYNDIQQKQQIAFWLSLIASIGLITSCFYLSKILMSNAIELEMRQEKYDLAIQASQAALWELDLSKGGGVFTSSKWKEMLGYGINEIGDSITIWESLIHPSEKAQVLKSLAEFIEGKLATFDLEIKMKHKDGSYHTILTQAAALRNLDGKAYRVAGSHIDISAKKINDAINAYKLAQEKEEEERESALRQALLDATKNNKKKPAPKKPAKTPARKPRKTT